METEDTMPPLVAVPLPLENLPVAKSHDFPSSENWPLVSLVTVIALLSTW